MQSTYIFLNEVRFYAYHGVMPEEKVVGTDFLVSLRVGYDFSRAMESDNVEDTVSYADLYELVKREMAITSDLVEHVAGRIVRSIKSEFPQVTSIDLRLTKLNPPMGADCQGAGVEIHV